jgi:DNA-binding beta-propeller fold protein YncE
MPTRRRAILLAVALAGLSCNAAPNRHAVETPARYTVHALALPGAPDGGVFMDYLAYDRARHRVWVPAGNTGCVDVVDTSSEHVTRIDGFRTADIERGGVKRTVGPSSATVGDGFVFVGNRGDSSVCAFQAASLAKAGCIKLDSMPDGLAYIAATHEVWVTTPRTKSITVLGAASSGTLSAKETVSLDGAPEGFAVDDTRHVFYTNLEDRDRTLAIDVVSRHVTETWMPTCGEDGPKGLALDRQLDFLFVACSDHVLLLDAGHHGKQLSRIDTGSGVDNIDYVEKRRELYVAAARAATLTVAHLSERGTLATLAVVPTAKGARNAVATDEGVAYVADSPEGTLLVVGPAIR